MLLLAALSTAWLATPQEPLDVRIGRLLESPAANGGLSGVAVAKADGTVLYQRNGSLRLVPASNQKLLSVAFALHTLGPDWRPETRFWKEEGRIFVDCPGDPSMTYGRLQETASKLKIPTGTPIYARQGYRAGVPPTWENDDLPHRYAPRITAFTLNGASFTLAAKDGALTIVPEPFGVRIMHFPNGTIRTDFNPYGNLMVVRGEVPKENRNLENFAIPEPDRAAASVLGGRLFEATSLPDRAPDLTLRGTSVGELAGACLKPSDNYLGECLMLLAAIKSGPVFGAEYTRGPARMREFLTKTVGIPAAEVRPYDGSGMSRHNFVSPLAIVRVLAWSRGQPWGQLWVDAMAQPGKPGTLSTRLTGTSFVGKTGSLNSVASLSGYVKSANGETLIVSTMFNHFIVPASEIRALADAIVKEVEKTGMAPMRTR
jgi:D-alanyl-D-alanine carboxypeptidase/D-alanyl-D-alanine-endopeptidase (penicillin-binding protein 4)